MFYTELTKLKFLSIHKGKHLIKAQVTSQLININLIQIPLFQVKFQEINEKLFSVNKVRQPY